MYISRASNFRDLSKIAKLNMLRIKPNDLRCDKRVASSCRYLLFYNYRPSYE